jgi:YVTN family beta-propeller protein/VCBS repeat-containing protein
MGHNIHFHPVTEISGPTGSITIPRTSDQVADTFYRISLTVTDSSGLSSTQTVDVQPRTVQLTVNATNTDGTPNPDATFTIDGQPFKGSHTESAVIGVQRVVSSATSQFASSGQLVFAGWSDAGAQTHTITTPATATTYTAKYSVLPVFTGPTSSAQTGVSPSGLAATSTKVYVTNLGSNTVSVIDRVNPAATPVTINVVASPAAIALGPQGSNRAYVAGNNAVSVIDTTTNQVIATVAINGGQSYGIALSLTGDRAYVSTTGNNRLAVINTTTNQVITTVAVGAYPIGVAASADGTRVYVANWSGNTVSVLNTATNTVSSTVSVGVNPFEVAVSPDSSRLYVSNASSNSVSVLNTAGTPSVLSTIGVGTLPFGLTMSPDGSFVYAANGVDTLSIISTATNTVINTVTVDVVPETSLHYVTASPDGRQVYVSDLADRTVRILTISQPNRAPIAGTPTVGTPDTNTGAVTGLLNFSDPDGDSLTYSVQTQPSAGAVVVTAAGAYTFTPNQAARDLAATTPGPDTTSVTVVASDGRLTRSVTFAVPISPPAAPNRAPVAGTPSVTSSDPATGVIAGLLNFTDPDGNPMTYSVPAQPSAGTVTTNNSTGGYTFTPNQAARNAAAGTPGPDVASVTVVANDGQASTSVTFNVTILPAPAVNVPPVVTGTTVGAPNQVTGVVAGVVTASDANGNPLTFSLSGVQPARGTVVVNANGTFTFTPTVAARLAAGQTAGPASGTFTVAVSDGQAITTTPVTVTVLPAVVAASTTTTTTGATPNGAVVVGNRAFVANQGAHTVSVIDTTTNAVVKTIAVGYAPTGAVASPDQTKVYVANGWSYSVSVIDTASLTVTATIPVGAGPVAVAISPDGSRLYTTNLSGNSVSVVNTTTRAVIATVAVGAYPNGAMVSPDGTRVYVTNQYSYTVSVINTSTNAVVATVPVGVTPSSVAVGATRAVVTNQGGNSVSIINTTTATPTVIATVTLPAGSAPTSVILSKDATVAYVANSNDTVSVIDLTTAIPALMHTITVDTTAEIGAHTLALSADGTRIYLTDAADNVLRLINYQTGSTTA